MYLAVQIKKKNVTKKEKRKKKGIMKKNIRWDTEKHIHTQKLKNKKSKSADNACMNAHNNAW